MKNYKKYFWNIERKSKRYWLSFVVLLFPCIFVLSIVLIMNFPINISIFKHNLIVLECIYILLLIAVTIVLIIGLEACLSISRRKKNKDSGVEFLYSFIKYPQFKADVSILGSSIVSAIFVCYYSMDWLNPDSASFLLLLVMIMAGSCINLLCIFPWRKYRRILNSIKEQKGVYQEAWFCIPAGAEVSTFSVLPGQCEDIPLVVTEKELSIINKRKKCEVKGRDFNKLLVYIHEVTDREIFRDIVEEYSIYSHMRCLVILKEEAQKREYEKEIALLKERMEAQVILEFKEIHSLNVLDEYLGIKYTYNVVKCLREGKSLQNMGEILDDVYINIVNGPEVAVKFFRVCLTEPNLTRAIYQFFDYIDLQYRLVCAFFAPENINWYVKKSDEIGNIRKMFRFVVGNLKTLNEVEKIDIDFILDDEMSIVLQQYIPKFSKKVQIKQRLGSEEIKDLSADLRNRLRAHQGMDPMDVPVLLNLVFRVSIATNYILGLNKMVIHCGDDGRIAGNCGDEKDRQLSPFLKMNQGHYCVFNNVRKEGECYKREYMDFLTGEVKQEKYWNVLK